MADVQCETCGLEPAVVRVTRIVRNMPLESHVCQRCAVPDLAALPQCARCGKPCSVEELQKLFKENPVPPMPFDPAAFQEWESRFTCSICGGRLFP